MVVEALQSDGTGRVGLEGIELYVRGAYPGEKVEVFYEHVGKRRHDGPRRVYGKLNRLVEGHPGRRDVPCERCDGCPWMSLDEPSQRTLKREWVEREYGLVLDAELVAGEGFAYRWSSKRVVGGKPGQLRLGSYRRGSHRVARMDGCLVDHPDIVSCFEEVEALASQLSIAPYDGGRGLRYVWAKTNGAGDVLITLVSGREDRAELERLATALTRPAGVAWSAQDQHGNSLRGDVAVPLVGSPTIDVELAGVSVSVAADGFLQPNPTIAARAYADLVRNHAGESVDGDCAWDLYAGAGVTTQLLRAHFGEVTACELHGLTDGAAKGDGAAVAVMSVESFLSNMASANRTAALVLANPPRAGLGETVCALLVRVAPARIHIMSCNPASLARDIQQLAPHYELEGVRAYETLPQTQHIELIAWLIKKG